MTQPLVLIGSDGSNQGRSRDYQFTYSDYVCALEDNGLSVLIVPWQDSENLKSLVDRAQGLVIPGGDDLIFPDRLAEETPVDPKRQDQDVKLVELALEKKMPLLGVCYGMQLIQYVYGGEIVRHLPNADFHTDGNPHKLVGFREGEKWFGKEPWTQESFHHQGIEKAADGLETLVLSEDGLIEGFWDPKFSFVAGFQWHVEKRQSDADMRILKEFSEASQRYWFKNSEAPL